MLITNAIFNKSESKETIIGKLVQLFSCDCDWCGDNGDEYLLEEANSLGFECNNDWFVDTNFKSIEIESLESLINDYFGLNSYWNHKVLITEFEDIIFISLAWEDNN